MTPQNSEQHETLELIDFVRDLTNSYTHKGVQDVSVAYVINSEGQVSFRVKGSIPDCFNDSEYKNLVIGTKLKCEPV